MFYNVLNAEDLVTTGERKFVIETLMEHDTNSLNIVAIKKDEIIETHVSVEDAAVYVLDGEIEIHFEAEKFIVKKGEILMFKKDKEHKVLGLKDSKFFVIRI